MEVCSGLYLVDLVCGGGVTEMCVSGLSSLAKSCVLKEEPSFIFSFYTEVEKQFMTLILG